MKSSVPYPDLVSLLNSAFEGPAWHGPSVHSSVRGVHLEEARWKSSPDRNSIRQLVLHIAYGKYLVLGRLQRGSKKQFARRLAKSWWPRVEGYDDSAWESDIELMNASHSRLIAGVEAASESRLNQSRKGSSFTLRDEVSGIALHDAYHAGQIRLSRRLYAERR